MLSRKQLTILGVMGVIFWILFAVIIRSLPMVFNAGLWNGVLFIVTIPIGWFLVSFTQRIADLKPDLVVTGVTLAFAVAFLIDGVVFTWFEGIYGETAVHVRTAAAYILYGAGVTLCLAIFRRQTGKL